MLSDSVKAPADTALKSVSLGESLAYRLSRAGVLVAIAVGILTSGLQVYLDYGRQSETLDLELNEMLNVAEKPAALAVFTIDYQLAEQVAQSLLVYGFVTNVSIIGDHGERLGEAEKPAEAGPNSWFSGLLDETITMKRTLAPPLANATGAGPGELSVTISRAAAFEGFFDRAVIVFLVGLARNFLLTLVLLYVFTLIAARPLREFVDTFRRLDTANPNAAAITPPQGHENSEIGVLVETGRRVIEELSEQIEERRRAERELEQQILAREAALEDAMAANEAKTVFLAHMSHEFRTPLNAIIGYSEMIADRYEDFGPERVKEFVRPIHQAGNILRSHIDEILFFAELEQKRRELALTDLPARSAMASAIRLLRPRFRKRRVRVTVTGRRNAVPVRAEHRALTQVFANILENAIKYGPAGGTIEIGFESDGDRCSVAIRDAGPGIAETEIDEVLKPFNRSRNPYVASHPGTGLGLAICVELLSLMGGELILRNRPEGGLEARITLPRA